MFANKAEPETLNRATGIVLVVLGIAIMSFSYLIKLGKQVSGAFKPGVELKKSLNV